MKRVDGMRLVPSVVLPCGMMAAMWVATHAQSRGVRGLGGMAVLCGAMMLAARLSQRTSQQPARHSRVAMFVVAGVAATSAILMEGDAGAFRTVIPVLGIVGWMALAGPARAHCQPFRTTEGSR